jgi:catechol 2,3-dioxygenase-like lactoylglutathione lyase family enzyme
MEARIDIITLAVADLERALWFYRDGLGLESRGVIGTEFAGDDVEPAGAIALFELPAAGVVAFPRINDKVGR